MDVDHEAHKRDVPPATVNGEAERTAAEDPSDQIRDVLEDAQERVDQDSDDEPDAEGHTPDSRDSQPAH
jgi:hypothetical protein